MKLNGTYYLLWVGECSKKMVLVQSQLITADDNRHEEHVQVKTLDIGETEIQSQQ